MLSNLLKRTSFFLINYNVWVSGGNLSVARYNLGGAGSQSAGLAFGGNNGIMGPFNLSSSEEYNGTSWSDGGNLATPRYSLSGAGKIGRASCRERV